MSGSRHFGRLESTTWTFGSMRFICPISLCEATTFSGDKVHELVPRRSFSAKSKSCPAAYKTFGRRNFCPWLGTVRICGGESVPFRQDRGRERSSSVHD